MTDATGSPVHDPRDTYLHLAPGPGVQVIPVTDDFWPTLDTRADLHTGRLVTGYTMSEDWSTWERHPAGDEVVAVTAGEARFHLDDGTTVSQVTVRAPQFVLVPAGVWHTADIAEPVTMLVITWGEGTEHRPR